MSSSFDKLLKSSEEIKDDIIRDFAEEFLNEVQKLMDYYGKEDLMNMLNNHSKKSA